MNTQQILGNSCIWGERQGNGTGQGNLNLRDLLLFLVFNPKQRIFQLYFLSRSGKIAIISFCTN